MSSYSFKSSGPQTRPDRVKAVPVDRSPAGFRSRSSSIASSASFASAVEAQNGHSDATGAEDGIEPVRFSPDEEKTMIDAAHTLKAAANKQFAAKDFSSAISTYDKALAELPIYLDYELAVLQSNIAACHLQLQQWKEAIDSAERGLDNLERELPMAKPRKQKDEKNGSGTKEAPEMEDKVVELPDDQSDEQTTEALKNLTMSDQHKQDILRIRTKLLLRRARAKVMLCEVPPPSAPKPASYLDPDNPMPSSNGPSQPKKTSFGEAGSQWSNLSTAMGDYQTLAEPTYFHILPSADQRTVVEMLRTLPPRVEAAKKKEVDEMMGKLKELGNGILKPFGLSTDMFKMVQDPNTGGYSINFDQKGGK